MCPRYLTTFDCRNCSTHKLPLANNWLLQIKRREIDLNISTICNKKKCKHRENSTKSFVSLMIGTMPNRNGDIEVKKLKRDGKETAMNHSMELMNSSKIDVIDMLMVPMEEHYICENKAGFCEENHLTLGADIDVAPVGKHNFFLTSHSQVSKYFQAKRCK